MFGRSLRAGIGNADLLRTQLAWGGSALGSWTFFIALAVFAYHVGATTGVGLAAAVRMVPAGLVAPVAGALVDRFGRRDVVLATLALRSVLVAAIAAVVAAGGSFPVVLLLAAMVTVVMTAHKPAQAALLPALADTPVQLGAASALWTAVDNAAFLVGSLLGGALIATTSVETALATTAVIYALAAVPMAGVARDRVPDYRGAAAAPGPVAAALAGLRCVAANRDARLIVGFLAAGTLVEGAIDVLIVAVAIETLDLGSSGVGWLNSAWGFGGLVGAGLALALLGRGRMSCGIAVGGLLVGASAAFLAGAWSAAPALAALVTLGVGYALVESAALSLLARLTSDEVLGRAFAVVEATYWLATGVGALLAPVAVGLLGLRGALLAVGAALPFLVAARWRALSGFEEHAVVPEREYGALRRLAIFAPLPVATVENLARRVAPVRVGAGAVVIRRGECGEHFYVVADGVLDVSDCDGTPAQLLAGDFFGEIALLRDLPRAATVTARDQSLLFVLDRDAFLTGIGGHPCAAEAVERVMTARLNGA